MSSTVSSTVSPTSPTVSPIMFCLPYAGGGAAAYNGLQRELAGRTDLTVVALQLPGRENRIAEPPAFTIGEVADEVAAHLTGGQPYVLYGHSMGARLAFEVVRELRRRGLPQPSRLYAGGAHAPDRKVPLAAGADLPDDSFIDALVRRSGALPELRNVPELRELMLPVLRADFAWIKHYRYTPEPPIDSPIVAFTGLDDGEVGPADMLGWARHTTSGFRLRTLRGGHLFVKDRPAELAALIAADLAAEHDPPEPDELHLWMDRRSGPAGGDPALPRHYRGRASVSHADGLTLAAIAHEPGIGVAVLRGLDRPYPLGEPDPALAELSGDEREQIEDAAEEDRQWLALRAVTAKRALMAAVGQEADPTLVSFPDLADPGPWRARPGQGPDRLDRLDRLDRWQVVHLPLHTSRGEALGAVAVPYDRVRLRFDMPAEQAG